MSFKDSLHEARALLSPIKLGKNGDKNGIRHGSSSFLLSSTSMVPSDFRSESNVRAYKLGRRQKPWIRYHLVNEVERILVKVLSLLIAVLSPLTSHDSGHNFTAHDSGQNLTALSYWEPESKLIFETLSCSPQAALNKYQEPFIPSRSETIIR